MIDDNKDFGKGEISVKSKEEPTAPKEEIRTVKEKTVALTDDELAKVTGGVDWENIKAILKSESNDDDPKIRELLALLEIKEYSLFTNKVMEILFESERAELLARLMPELFEKSPS